MNGMTSTKRIFALLDAPEPERGDATLPGGGRDLTVTFNAVAYRYADAMLSMAPLAPTAPSTRTLIHPSFRRYRQFRRYGL